MIKSNDQKNVWFRPLVGCLVGLNSFDAVAAIPITTILKSFLGPLWRAVQHLHSPNQAGPVTSG